KPNVQVSVSDSDSPRRGTNGRRCVSADVPRIARGGVERVVGYVDEPVLPEGPGLDDQLAGANRTEVDEPHDRLFRITPGHQRRDVERQARTPSLDVEVANWRDEQAAVINRRGGAEGELNQPLGQDRIQLLPVVDVYLGQVRPVRPDQVEPPAHLREALAQDLLGIARVVAGEEA